MNRLIQNDSWLIKFYSIKDNEVLTSTEALAKKISVNKNDIHAFLNNGLFSLRRPGEYLPVAGLVAMPPKTCWNVSSEKYSFHSNLINKKLPEKKNWDQIEKLGEKYLNITKHKKIAVELSGGLDTSIIIEFFLKKKIDFHLIGFISDRWEFRTERAIQEYYINKIKNHTLFSYENNPAFNDLKNSPPHPLPQQESLFYKRHQIVAEAAIRNKCDYVFSGEAGDQIFGFSTEDVITGNDLPSGYGFWSLSELWNSEFIYRVRGVEYISALAVGDIPAYLMSRRSEQKSDHMKLWIRKELKNILPSMLSKYAYKGFHDGWVAEGLRLAEASINTIASISFDAINHPELEPKKLIHDSQIYSSMSESLRSNFLARLAFVNWLHSLIKNNFIN
jgi:asparagine synthetase B (glutamine-hydrolysing)